MSILKRVLPPLAFICVSELSIIHLSNMEKIAY